MLRESHFVLPLSAYPRSDRGVAVGGNHVYVAANISLKLLDIQCDPGDRRLWIGRQLLKCRRGARELTRGNSGSLVAILAHTWQFRLTGSATWQKRLRGSIRT